MLFSSPYHGKLFVHHRAGVTKRIWLQKAWLTEAGTTDDEVPHVVARSTRYSAASVIRCMVRYQKHGKGASFVLTTAAIIGPERAFPKTRRRNRQGLVFRVQDAVTVVHRRHSKQQSNTEHPMITFRNRNACADPCLKQQSEARGYVNFKPGNGSWYTETLRSRTPCNLIG